MFSTSFFLQIFRTWLSKCFWGSNFARCPYGDVFFTDFVTCAIFPHLWGEFLKNQNKYGHHVFAKSCVRLHYRRKKLSKNFGIMIFQKEFLKRTVFDCFLLSSHYISELRPNTGSMVSYNVHAFHRLFFWPKNDVEYFPYLVLFWASKRWKKCRKIFSHL